MVKETFHEGETAMQQRAGVTDLATRVGRIIGPTIPPPAAAFLAAQRFVITSTADGQGLVTASIIPGPPGFAAARDERNAVLDCAAGGKPPAHVRRVLEDVEASGRIGILAIDLAARRRLRLNGRATRHGLTIRISTSEVYANCPQYIHPRPFDGIVTVQESTVLTAGQQTTIAAADTFFLATLHPQRGADASHRGGDPGFVRIESPTRLSWPDLPGNNMFNSLGNVLVSPRCSLLFIDFDTRRAFVLRGTASVEGDEQRRVVFDVL